MEQTVWLYFGVITVILSFGIVGKLMVEHKNQEKDGFFESAVNMLASKCRFVCESPLSTLLSDDVKLPSGIVLTTMNDKICGSYEGEYKCDVCNCEIRPYELDLNTTVARETFDTHIYRCYFTRGKDDIQMECKG